MQVVVIIRLYRYIGKRYEITKNFIEHKYVNRKLKRG